MRKPSIREVDVLLSFSKTARTSSTFSSATVLEGPGRCGYGLMDFGWVMDFVDVTVPLCLIQPERSWNKTSFTAYVLVSLSTAYNFKYNKCCLQQQKKPNLWSLSGKL
ncbi:hypothetical protein AVEN_213126-1 [Araneus ventricosus]|uniref:Uncharacterized protein n=1 Tax=Araneus ventricosus TaxID=182803 RepID=A0A4Y2N0Y4_ARAVE|nr:hypothetical protein AVEN_213126-1 [Araneus ventricosus]